MKTSFTRFFTFFFLLISSQIFSQADDARLKELQEETGQETLEGWTSGGGIGLDFTQVALINPRVGSGTNRVGFGALGSAFANYQSGKFTWQNTSTIQVSVQRNGSKEVPYVKNLDLFRLNSRLGFETNNEKWGIAADANIETLLLKTYEGNLLKEPRGDTLNLIAGFFSPMRLSFSPGITYEHNENWKFFVAPVAIRLIYVADEDIAALNLHGNEPGKKSFLQLGSNIQAAYNNKFWNDKAIFTSRADLFINYREKDLDGMEDTRSNPKNLDFLWVNDLNIEIFKNLSLAVRFEMFWDADVLVNIDKNDNGIFEAGEVGHKVSWTEGIYLKYNVIF